MELSRLEEDLWGYMVELKKMNLDLPINNLGPKDRLALLKLHLRGFVQFGRNYARLTALGIKYLEEGLE